MNQEYVNLIKQLDGVLSTLHEFYMNSKTKEDKAKWRIRIDESLDERLRLMKCRDATESEKTS
jgi:hypothetical protein